ncbi:DUF1542 domain-containing protein [Staphylococcus haemolyticus]|uniref:DUF1542 domain-containing protein n=1 Tax=Staphylococcus haemolyticus TaxID=1283 RepID=UPI00384C73C4
MNQLSDATQEEKDAAIQRVTDEVRKADRLIDQSTTNDGVDEFQAHGISAISNIQPEIVKKSDAKQSIDIAVLNQKALVNNNNEATQEEKDVALAKIDEAAKQAKAAIDAATAKKEAINNTPNATEEEKVAAKAKVDEAVTGAKKAIDQVTNNASVDTAKSNGIEAINHVQPTVVKKDEAKTAIDNAARTKKAEIDQTPNATEEEKAAAKAKVDEAVKIAKENIDKSLNNNEVDESLNKGELKIKNVQTTVIAKEKAIKHLMDIATKQKAKIDSNQFATDEEKSTAKHKIDQIINKAYAAIKKAKSNSEVNNIDDKYSKLISETNTIAKAIHDTLLKQIVEEKEVKLNNIKFNIVQSTEKVNEIQKEESKNKKEKVNYKLEVTKFNGSSQLPNTGVNMTSNLVPLTQLSLISGLFLLLISKRRKNAK